MALLIHLMNGNPQRQKGETHAGLMILRDDKLGWRVKATAMPSKREIFRLVSDCPLTIAEQAILWAKKNDWPIKLHPNSLNIKQLIREVKDHTSLLPPDQNILALAMLIKNFLPPTQQQADGLPDFNVFDSNEKVRQTQPTKTNTSQKSKSPPVEQPPQKKEWTGAAADKMNATEERYTKHMAGVNATVEAQKKREEMQKQIKEQMQQQKEEITSHYEDLDPDELAAEIDDLLEEHSEDFSIDEDMELIKVPSSFDSPEHAQKWAVEAGVFLSMKDAAEAYTELKDEAAPKSAKEMADYWTQACSAVLEG